MKILYLSDRYAWDMYGVKRSLYESLLQTVPVDFVDYQEYHPEVRSPIGPREALSTRHGG